MYVFTSWGIADNDPVYQQLLLDVEKSIEDYIIHEQNAGSFTRFKGDAQYWNVLDNSHQTGNFNLIENV